MFKKDDLKAQKQIKFHPKGFYCNQRKIGDEKLNWYQASREVFNFVRGICSPGPIARAKLNNKEMKINKVEFIKNAPIYMCTIGVILNKSTDSFLVKTKDSYIRVTEFEFNGVIKVGDRFEI